MNLNQHSGDDRRQRYDNIGNEIVMTENAFAFPFAHQHVSMTENCLAFLFAQSAHTSSLDWSTVITYSCITLAFYVTAALAFQPIFVE